MTLVARQTLILASASLARAKILAAAGLTVTVDPVNVDESAVKDAFHAERRDASSCAIALAETKALAMESSFGGMRIEDKAYARLVRMHAAKRQTREASEGLASFAEKRAAKWDAGET